MINNERISCIPKSLSLNSLNTQATTDNSVLTSTKNQEEDIKSYIKNNRRKAILPTPNKPKNIQKLLTMNNKKETNIQEQIVTSIDNRNKSCDTKASRSDTDNTTDNSCIRNTNLSTHSDANFEAERSYVVDSSDRQNRISDVEKKIDELLSEEIYKRINVINRVHQNFEDKNEIEDHSQQEHEANDDSFDTFILHKFVPFSGKQNVSQWLDETENKFKQFSIGRNLRFDAISLLVEGDARRQYIKNRKEIRSFDDFYEFLISTFESTDNASCQIKSRQNVDNNSGDLSVSHQTKSINDSAQAVSNNANAINLTGQTSVCNSNAMVNFGATNVTGERPVNNSTIVFDQFSNSFCDQTLNDLRKAIVENLIKNPKTFKGGKDDVKKWLEEIEHLLDVAHIQDSTRLDLISYSLRGDALEWFKNNRSSLSSWSVFVSELKKAFTSSFHEELAFKTLESYTQGENQSIRNFFNEVLKLCKDADATMSEATKLKNLLNRTKPSIQFEVRKKKPKSTAEFLEYAKEAEELMQLSNITTDNPNINKNNTQVAQQQPIP
ncbi:unnamed protein product, partial [Rotaria magnacalcarata]